MRTLQRAQGFAYLARAFDANLNLGMDNTLVSRGLTANSIWVKMGALRFFYRTTLWRPVKAPAMR